MHNYYTSEAYYINLCTVVPAISNPPFWGVGTQNVACGGVGAYRDNSLFENMTWSGSAIKVEVAHHGEIAYEEGACLRDCCISIYLW